MSKRRFIRAEMFKVKIYRSPFFSQSEWCYRADSEGCHWLLIPSNSRELRVTAPRFYFPNTLFCFLWITQRLKREIFFSFPVFNFLVHEYKRLFTLLRSWVFRSRVWFLVCLLCTFLSSYMCVSVKLLSVTSSCVRTSVLFVRVMI